MISTGFFTRSGNATRRVGSIAAAALVAVVMANGSALADPCIEDATVLSGTSGTPLGCTANDFGVGSVTVTNLSEPCTSEGDSFTFDGTLNVDPTSGGAADRYDVGFYIGADGEQALTGDCAVSISTRGHCQNQGTAGCNVNADCTNHGGGTCLPGNCENDETFGCSVDADCVAHGGGGCKIVNDGDTCGDYIGDTNYFVPVSGVTAKCVDQDQDGFFDLAICTSYDNNAGGTCSDTTDATPSTKSKCRCSVVNTDQEIPHCNVNTDCTTDNNICTDEVCLGLNQPGADFFGCGHVNNTLPCPDGTFCNGVDVCAAGVCTHPGDPCGNNICEDCNEAGGNCFATGGTPCRPAVNLCDAPENCSGSATTCPADGFQPTTIVCRASAGVCDPQEVCTGTSAACQATGFLPTNTVCRASSGVCDPAEQCTGSSGACPNDGFLASSTICRASAGECDPQEQCTGSTGPCPGDSFDPNGTPCTPDSNICTDDECNGVDATCHHPNNSDPCDDANECTDPDICSGGSCTGGAPIDCSDNDDCTEDRCEPGTGCINNLICADICRSPGFWATHSGYEQKSDKKEPTNYAQSLIAIMGPISVCGQTISATSNAESPFLEGLGLTSDLQGLCMRTKGVHQRQLYRQLVAAALNCAASGAVDCDNVANTYMDVDFQDCSDICAGIPVVDPPTTGECIGQLDCFNNGGQVILGTGKCATGTCPNEQEVTYCGGDFGACPLFEDLPQDCVDFENNCHAQALCNEETGWCPKQSPASSTSACREARFDDCTIDSCGP